MQLGFVSNVYKIQSGIYSLFSINIYFCTEDTIFVLF